MNFQHCTEIIQFNTLVIYTLYYHQKQICYGVYQRDEENSFVLVIKSETNITKDKYREQ